MRIICLSDTHGELPSLDLTDIDLVLHGGDYSLAGKEDYAKQLAYFEKAFCPWVRQIANTVAIYYIDGNHETFREAFTNYTNDVIEKYNINNKTVTFKGKNIYGFPWTPYFYIWAFNLFDNRYQLGEKCDTIPENTDILLSHGPIYGVMDLVKEYPRIWRHCGSKELALRVDKIRPQLVVSGHLHENFGVLDVDGIKYVGASMADENYDFSRQPIVLEI